jgi:hypothetical protein
VRGRAWTALPFYPVGQRKRINVGLTKPLYVLLGGR